MIELTEFEKAVRAIACHDFGSQGFPDDEEVREMSNKLIALLDLPTWEIQNRRFTQNSYQISGNTLYYNDHSLKLEELEKLPSKKCTRR